MMNSEQKIRRLLLFNLATDADESALGFALEWIAELAKHAAHIDIITMRAGRYELPTHVCVYSVGKEKGYSEPRRVIEFYRLLFRLLRQHRYDACFAHMMPLFAAMAGPILRLNKIPLILWYAHKSVTPILRVATFFARRVVTSVQQGFRIKTPKCRIIGQGIATERFVPRVHASRHNRPFTILTVGRISQAKRIDLLVNATAVMRQRHPEIAIRVAIVGAPFTEQDRLYAASITQQISHEQLEEVIIMHGSVPFGEILHYYQDADCCVNLCLTGAIDKVVLEAMSCGVIPVVTNLSFREVLGSEIAALCVTGDDQVQIATRIAAIHALSEDARQAIGEELRAIVVREHSLVLLCQKILDECVILRR